MDTRSRIIRAIYASKGIWMKYFTFARLTVSCLTIVSLMSVSDKPAQTYQKGTIMGYENKLLDKNRRTRVYELKGQDHIYQVDRCGTFQAGKFDAGQTVEYRVSGDRLYIRRDGDKEYSCKIEGERTAEDATTGASSRH